jgi:hypothetical protein
VHPDVHQAFLDGPAYDGVGEGALQQLGHDGKDINSHLGKFCPAKLPFLFYFSIFVSYNKSITLIL